MKYFTPDLLARFGSTDDQIADAAQEEWEQVHEKYLGHLAAIRSSLPRPAQSLLSKVYLHDARVHMIGREDRSLSMLLRPSPATAKETLITYRLADQPRFLSHPSLSEEGVPLEWLYDELDVTRRGRYPDFSHSILFTGGRELQLDFYDFRWKRYRKVILLPRNALREEGGADELEAVVKS